MNGTRFLSSFTSFPSYHRGSSCNQRRGKAEQHIPLSVLVTCARRGWARLCRQGWGSGRLRGPARPGLCCRRPPEGTIPRRPRRGSGEPLPLRPEPRHAGSPEFRGREGLPARSRLCSPVFLRAPRVFSRWGGPTRGAAVLGPAERSGRRIPHGHTDTSHGWASSCRRFDTRFVRKLWKTDG